MNYTIDSKIENSPLAIVIEENKTNDNVVYGVLNTITNKFLLPLTHQDIRSHTDLIWTIDEATQQETVYNLQLEKIYVPIENEQIENVAYNYIIVKYENSYGVDDMKLLDKTGNIIIPYNNQEIKILDSNKFCICDSECYSCVVDINNNVLMPLKKGIYEAFKDGIYIFNGLGDVVKYQLLNTKGDIFFEVENENSETNAKMYKVHFDELNSKTVVKVNQLIGEYYFYYVNLDGTGCTE